MTRLILIAALLGGCGIDPARFGNDPHYVQIRGHQYEVRIKDGYAAGAPTGTYAFPNEAFHQANVLTAMEQVSGCRLKNVRLFAVSASAHTDC